MNKLRFGTWNVRTLLDDAGGMDRPRRRTALVASELGRFNIDIAALSETRLSGEGSLSEHGEGYTFFWRGYPPGVARMHGVAMAVKSSLLRKITDAPVYISERLMTLRVPLARNEYATVVSAYAPTLSADEDTKDQFYLSLDEVLNRVDRKDKIVLLGDFNARVGKDHEIWSGAVGRHGVGKMNANGLRLLTLCAEHNLVITNTSFRLKNKYKTSWMHPRSRHWHLIDYVIVRKSDLADVMKTRAMRSADCWTDHRLIVSDMKMVLRPPRRRRQAPRKKLNCAALHDEGKKRAFHERLNELLAEIPHISVVDPDPDEVETTWDCMTSAMLSAAADTVGLQGRKHRDWFDENSTVIHELLAEKNSAHNAVLRNPSSVILRTRFRELRSAAQRSLRELENQWWVSLAGEIQGFADSNDTHNFYDSLKRIYGPSSHSIVPVRNSNGDSLIRDREKIVERWAEHFDGLLNGGIQSDHTVLDELDNRMVVQQLDLPPTYAEIQHCVARLKNNKATGGDGLPAELLKYGGEQLLRRLHEVIVAIWERERVPQKWKDANIITIFKNKGDRSICGNSRGISLLSVAGKVLARVMLARLTALIAEEIMPETQCGFRQNRSTVDMMFVSRQLMEKCREQHRTLYVAFVDLSKAFDTVDRVLLWELLKKCGCPPKYISVLRELHDGMMARVCLGGEESEPFEVTRGVRQGCVLAPVLFNIYIHFVTRMMHQQVAEVAGIHVSYRTDRSVFDLRKLQARTKTSLGHFCELQYADDCALVAHTVDGLQALLRTIASLYERFGLQINVQKTEVLQYFPDNPEAELHVFNVGDSALRNVPTFKYLGSFLSEDCKLDNEIQHRISQASSAFGRLRCRVFENHSLTLRTKVQVYHAVCLSTLLYGAEAWTMYRRHFRILEAWHIRCLQRILGLTWRDRVPHSEILMRTGCLSLEAIMYRRQLRWLGHVVRMPDDRLPKQVLYGELQMGARSAGGQKKRQKDYFKATLRRCNIQPGQLEELASERSLWRSLCNDGVESFEEDRHRRMHERRERRHQMRDAPPAHGQMFPCPTCNRQCASRIGLHSHMEAHRRRQQGEPPVVVGIDGLP
jgi:exonuclease III